MSLHLVGSLCPQTNLSGVEGEPKKCYTTMLSMMVVDNHSFLD